MRIKIEDKEITPPDSDAIRKIESQHLQMPSLKDTTERGWASTYEWLENEVIEKKASAEIGRDETGCESATIKMVNPKTNKEEVVYYTTDKSEIARLKMLLETGKIIVDESK